VLPKGREVAISRDQLSTSGFGQLGPRVVLAPSTAAEPERARQLADLEPIWLEAAAAPADAARLAAAAWDLAPISERYRRYIDLIGTVERQLGRAGAPPPREAFAARTLMIHAFRRVVLRDPCLPLPVLPADWPGRAAREVTGDLYRRLVRPSEAWLEEIGRTRSGALPPADQSFWARFGGLAPAPLPRHLPRTADAG
jgi:phenylacetic acid degradation operon negative regulatory protein